MKIKKGDEVHIVKGKDKGKRGKVEKVLVKEGKVLIPGINQYKKHVKAKSVRQKSEIITIAKPLPIENVLVVCPKCNKPTRVGFVIEDKTKKRICKKCEQIL